MARATINKLGKSSREKPIWVTEIGWPVKGHGAEDGTHLLVSEGLQRDLLNSSFEMMKGGSPLSPEINMNLTHVFYYNISDWINAVPPNANPHAWEAHCGLLEELGGGESGGFRKGWGAFQDQAK